MGTAFGIRLRLTGRKPCRRAAVLLNSAGSLAAASAVAARAAEGWKTGERILRRQKDTGTRGNSNFIILRGALFIIMKPLRAAVAGGDKERADLEFVPGARRLAQHSKRDPASIGSA